jgi:XTP/dITP diphosphohydrolase
MVLVIATHNVHKVEEIRAILGAEGLTVQSLSAYPSFPAPEETGRTFSENASLKAIGSSLALGPDSFVLADDSGLEVDGLQGAPGVDSAIYAGHHGDDAGNRAKLLAELQSRQLIEPSQRTGRFRCVLCLSKAGIALGQWEGSVEGLIAPAEAGDGGFGYDSLFIPNGFDRTFAELPSGVKNDLSHRGKALTALKTWWRETGQRQIVR